MKIAILGASGFIGKNLASRLIRDGNQVTSFVRNKQSDPTFDIGYRVEFDFGDLSSISSTLSGFDVMIHLVSGSNPTSSRQDVRREIENNLLSTLDLLTTLKQTPETRLVFASSGGAVYGKPESIPIAESHATNPVSPYGVSKLAIEKFLHISSLESGLDYRILRLSNPYGPLQLNTKGQGLIPTVIEAALKGQILPVWGDGSNTRDYIYIDDVVEAFVRAVDYKGDIRTFNVGSGVGSSVLEIVSEVTSLTGKDLNMEFFPARESDPPSNVLDVTLAQAELGWDTRTTLREGLGKSIAWNMERLGF